MNNGWWSIESKFEEQNSGNGTSNSSSSTHKSITDAFKLYFGHILHEVNTEMLVIVYSDTQNLLLQDINNLVNENETRIPTNVKFITVIGSWNLWFMLAKYLYSSIPQTIRFYSNSYHKMKLPTSVREYLRSSKTGHSI